ncbi:MAG: DoxX family protein [Thermoleophilaceae bacterium]
MQLLRTLIGLLFAAHGAQKLFGWFGGGGPAGTGEMFESMGLSPGKRNALAAGAAETGGGALIAADIGKPLAAAALSGSMVTAVRHAHLPKGLWNHEGGYEYNLVLLAGIFAIVAEDDGLPWAIGALAAGAAGSFATTALAEREAETVEEEAVVREAPRVVAPVT